MDVCSTGGLRPVRKFLLALIVALCLASPAHAGGVVREIGQACVFGGTLFGLTTVFAGSVPLELVVVASPVGPAIAGSMLVGCSLIATANLASNVFIWLYDRLSAPLPPRRNDRLQGLPASIKV
ncbi:membrane hypothetical protein [uncultured Gammaproteobacteria bacterium]